MVGKVGIDYPAIIAVSDLTASDSFPGIVYTTRTSPCSVPSLRLSRLFTSIASEDIMLSYTEAKSRTSLKKEMPILV